jgi:Carboxypeptidase regulatory-like domain/TonB-dependent Receptor Plug Domain
MVWKFRNTRVFIVFGAIALILLANIQIYAQVSGATLSGTVTDPSGAVVPNATLSIKNVATGIVRQITTDSSGVYTAPNLLPGTYEATVTAAGFTTTVQAGITLTVGAQQLLNFSLKVGDTSTKVEVSTEGLAVQLASSEISGVVSDRTVQELPLNGRDWTTLATLEPGVNSLSSDQANTGTKDRARRGYGVEMTISGSRPSQNNYRIDGINVNDYSNGGPGSVEGSTLGVDAVQEFSVLTSNYSAEYGRTSGGVINAITKSGTNDFHGSIYEFLRNGSLDAATFIDNSTGSPKPHFERNQFGGAVGGPIVKNNTFFFADYEGLRENLGTTVIANVPSAAVRGIGTGPGGGPGPSTVCSIQQFDPVTNPSGCKTQTLNNYLASHNEPSVLSPDSVTGIDKSVLPFLGLWQLPNQPFAPGNNGDVGQYAFNSTTRTNENFGTIRVDHKFSDKDSLFGTYQNDQATAIQPDPNNNVLVQNSTGRQFVDVEETHIFSAQLLNSARFGLNRSVHTGGGLSAINPLSANLALGESAGADNPQIDVSSNNITSIQPGLNQVEIVDFYQNSFQGYDDVFVTKGIHSLKFGFAVENIRTTAYNPAPVGEFPFNSLYDSSQNGFLTNNPATLFAPVPGVPFSHFQFHTTIFAGYAQDDVRLKPNLTLNIGLRYEMSTVPAEINNKLSALSSPDGQSLATATIGRTIFSNPTYHNFEPRIGFAWDPFGDGKSSVRGGFGMFDVLPLTYELGQFATNAAPFTENAAISQNSSQNALVQGDFPILAFNKLAANAANGLSFRVPYVEPHPKRNYVMQWNLAIQRELIPNLTVMLAYVGSRGVHMEQRADDINTTLPTLTSAGYLFPGPAPTGVTCGSTVTATTNPIYCPRSPNIGQMDTLQWSNDSFFHGMEVQVNKKMSHGFELGASYTWSRAIDGGDGAIASDSFLNSIPSLLYFLPKTRRGPSDFNVTNNLTLNYLWNIPSPLHGFGARATQGWQVGGILTVRSGLPFTPLVGGDTLGLSDTQPFNYPDRLSGPGCSSLVNPRNVQQYIKLQCFAAPNPLNLLGNAGRNVVVGPGLLNLDFSLIKETKINERLSLEFRAEAFNIINHANFNAPVDTSTLFDATGAQNSSAGLLDTVGPGRQIQFGLKLGF